MKFSAALILIVILGLVTNSSTLPARKRMVYVQQQPQWHHGGPQRMMYVQYVQPSRTHARSTQAAAALVAGDSIATGTYLNEADIAVAGSDGTSALQQKAEESQLQQNGEDILGASDVHSAQSVAEAYPEENEIQIQADEVVPLQIAAGEGVVEAAAAVAESEDTSIGSSFAKETAHNAAKAPRGYNFAAGTVADTENQAAPETDAETEAEKPVEAQGIADSATVDVTADLPPPAPIVPIAAIPAKPARRYLPAHKKVYVELEQSAEDDAAEVAEEEQVDAFNANEEEDDSYALPPTPVNPVRVPNAHRPTKKVISNKPKKAAQSAPAPQPPRAPKPLPAGTFFPVDFGGATGGAIAIANSFSTGEGGSATSHAIAYGAPDTPRARVRPSRLH